MTPDTNMVERVARAMAFALDATRIAGLDIEERQARIVERRWPRYVTAARAAIAAMREPTPEMIEAAWAEALAENAAGVWEAMIDAALAEGENG